MQPWRVVHHSRVYIRDAPHRSGKPVGSAAPGDVIRGMEQAGWVRLETGDFMLIDASQLGLGRLLEPHGPAALPRPPALLIQCHFTDAPTADSTAASARGGPPSDYALPGERDQWWRVVHYPRVAVRESPGTTAKAIGMRSEGTVVRVQRRVEQRERDTRSQATVAAT
eukprot:6991382-Prymnesium_polylepis.1